MSEEWVAQHGITKSISTPGRPGEMVYQVDMFHNLHCLVSFQIKNFDTMTKLESISGSDAKNLATRTCQPSRYAYAALYRLSTTHSDV